MYLFNAQRIEAAFNNRASAPSYGVVRLTSQLKRNLARFGHKALSAKDSSQYEPSIISTEDRDVNHSIW